MFSVAPNILLAPNMTQNAERKHRTQDANTAHNRLLLVADPEGWGMGKGSISASPWSCKSSLLKTRPPRLVMYISCFVPLTPASG